ncbi:MAG: 16S rRNA (cytidine(1402)-2'-O)-methyltransferase [Candidatus Eremiobacter antarcticus]|nr:16S rRNA (cytidine(1402)-2'-O)-methyltransferase [Candidatus Eremiobacteraeota bacterium]MBC5808011.1 16S rRNA (cytidine(1402)-2'-O)-methyltransferase [Candidatus Eremiobacteraeota bacterium]
MERRQHHGRVVSLTRRRRLKPDAASAGRAAAARGRLLVCPTPLGNLEDITLRVLRALRECDVIFAEDTRVTRKLLQHFDIRKPLRSFHERVEAHRVGELREHLDEGKTVAAVTDAGTPGISDPGAALVRTARAHGATVEVLPGPSAALSAIVLSGFECSTFRFDGFPPRKPGERRAYLQALASEQRPVIWFEAPSRVVALLHELAAVLPDRNLFVVREYTKKFEQQLVGTATEIDARLSKPARGEFTLVLAGTARHAAPGDALAASEESGIRAAAGLLRRAGVGVKDVVDALRLITGRSKNSLYRLTLDSSD